MSTSKTTNTFASGIPTNHLNIKTTSKRGKAQVRSQLDWVAFIGSAKIPLVLGGYEFRRLLRAAAWSCAQEESDNPRMTVEKIRRYAARYRFALFLLLGTISACTRYPDAFEVSAEDIDVQDGHILVVIKEMISTCKWRAAKRKVVLEKLEQVQLLCKLSTLQQVFEGLHEILHFQRKIGPIVGGSKSAVPANISHPERTPLIRESIPWEVTDPPLKVGINGSFFGYSTIHPTEISNSLAIGGTGSGKSQSLVIPMLNALLQYQLKCGLGAAILVVDPKKELRAHVIAHLRSKNEMHRLIEIGEVSPIAVLAEGRQLSMSDKLAQLLEYCPQESEGGDHAYWSNLARAMMLDFMQLEEAFALQTGGGRLAALLCSELQVADTAGRSYWQQLRALLSYSCAGHRQLKAVDTLLRFTCHQVHIQSRSVQVLETYKADSELLKQWAYVVQSAVPVINHLANPDHARFIDLDPISKENARVTHLARHVEDGKVVLFCPEGTESHRLAAKAIKATYLQAVFARQNMRRPIGLIVDELQRFITSGAQSETHFIDTFRAYRCISVLATQSLSSLKQALGSNALASTTVDILVANSPSRFFFRTTDQETTAMLKSQIPNNEGGPHVIDIRRPAMLGPGEAYFMLATGLWGRRRAAIVPAGATLKQQQMEATQ